jgi:hypothetical protein
MKQTQFWILTAIALLAGIAITGLDSRPGWDDTGITAGLILLTTAILGMLMPPRAWLWALLVGTWIPIRGIALHQNYGSILALVIAFVGAYSGALGRKVVALSGV